MLSARRPKKISQKLMEAGVVRYSGVPMNGVRIRVVRTGLHMSWESSRAWSVRAGFLTFRSARSHSQSASIRLRRRNRRNLGGAACGTRYRRRRDWRERPEPLAYAARAGRRRVRARARHAYTFGLIWNLVRKWALISFGAFRNLPHPPTPPVTLGFLLT